MHVFLIFSMVSTNCCCLITSLKAVRCQLHFNLYALICFRQMTSLDPSLKGILKPRKSFMWVLIEFEYCISEIGSNANAFAFKCILNTFEKYLHLHLKFSNEKYLHLHLKNFSNTFEKILKFLKNFTSWLELV